MLFLTGLCEFTNVDSTSNAPGYDVNTGGFTFGVDYRVTPNFAIDLTAGYAHTSVGIDSPGGNIDVNAGKIGIYAHRSLAMGSIWMPLSVGAQVDIPPAGPRFRAPLTAAPTAAISTFSSLQVMTGQKGNLTIGPTASFQYGYVGLNGFTETGSLAPLKFPDQNTESERTAFGAKATYEWKIGNVTAIPQVSAAWQHEFGSTEYSVVASLAQWRRQQLYGSWSADRPRQFVNRCRQQLSS